MCLKYCTDGTDKSFKKVPFSIYIAVCYQYDLLSPIFRPLKRSSRHETTFAQKWSPPPGWTPPSLPGGLNRLNRKERLSDFTVLIPL